MAPPGKGPRSGAHLRAGCTEALPQQDKNQPKVDFPEKHSTLLRRGASASGIGNRRIGTNWVVWAAAALPFVSIFGA
jgi:hypothetical protein